MIIWALKLLVAWGALWLATSIVRAQIAHPFEVVGEYLQRLLAFRPFPKRDSGGLTWNETVRYRHEAFVIAVLVVLFLSPAFPLSSGWRIAVELTWLLLALRLTYARLIFHPSRGAGYVIAGTLLGIGMLWSVVFWFLTNDNDVPKYWFAVMIGFLIWPATKVTKDPGNEGFTRNQRVHQQQRT